MFNRFKNVVIGAVGSLESNGIQGEPIRRPLAPKFKYRRPKFLNIVRDEDVDEYMTSADHEVRPIIHPNSVLPHHAGYAECCNAGKSHLNEDLACYTEYLVHKVITENKQELKKFPIFYTYYGLFDGHAGVGAALSASHDLHHLIHMKLLDALDDIWNNFTDDKNSKTASNESLITGALEAAFREMDQLIADDKTNHIIIGGCTALVALFILGKLYVANAGDSRAIICQGNDFIPMSADFTPENERERIRKLAAQQPHLLGNDFTSTEYNRVPKSADLGKPILYRDAYMKGWAYKLVQAADLKVPVITGQGKRSRLMGTIGVTRGFGDHDLLSVYNKVPIKPFLSCHPEIRIYELLSAKENDVLVMGTDGLWDILSERKASEIVASSISNFSERDRFVSAATCLVAAARGSKIGNFVWHLKNGKPSSADDISVFVIPILPYKLAYENMLKQFEEEFSQN